MNKHTATDPVSGMVATRNSKEHVYRFAVFVTYNEHAYGGGKRVIHGWSATRENAEKSVRPLTRPGRRWRGGPMMPAIVDSYSIVPATVTTTGSGAGSPRRRAPVHHHVHR